MQKFLESVVGEAESHLFEGFGGQIVECVGVRDYQLINKGTT
jgi:hypothetical protein